MTIDIPGQMRSLRVSCILPQEARVLLGKKAQHLSISLFG